MEEAKTTSRPQDCLAELLRRAPEGDETIFEVVRGVVGGGENAAPRTAVVIHRRKLQAESRPAPRRAETPPRQYTFHEIAGLVEYLKRFGSDNVVALADVDSQTIGVHIDERAERGVEILTCRPRIHPLLRPWIQEIFDKAVEVRAFAGFVAKYRRVIVEPDGRDLALTLSQVRASTKITLQVGRGAKAINGIVTETEIRGETVGDLVDLPETITLELPLYVGQEAQRIPVDLSLHAAADKVLVIATSADYEIARIEAFQAMIEKLQAAGDITVSMGVLSCGAWEYLTD